MISIVLTKEIGSLEFVTTSEDALAKQTRLVYINHRGWGKGYRHGGAGN